MHVENLKFKSPFIYKINGQYYALGMHTCKQCMSQAAIDAYIKYTERKDMKSFKLVLDLASLVRHNGDVEEFLSKLNPDQLLELEEQYKVFLEFSVCL